MEVIGIKKLDGGKYRGLFFQVKIISLSPVISTTSVQSVIYMIKYLCFMIEGDFFSLWNRAADRLTFFIITISWRRDQYLTIGEIQGSDHDYEENFFSSLLPFPGHVFVGLIVLWCRR